MKNFTQLFKFKAIALFAALFFVAAQAEATHFRYGTVTWQITSFTPTTRTVQFNITQSWRWSYFGNPAINNIVNPGPFQFGDNTNANLNMTITSINPSEDWFVCTTTLTKTYNATTDITAFFEGCCRISSLQQGNNDRNFRTETRVTLSNPTNRPPVGSTLPIFYVQTGLPNAQIQLNATDPDNDPISFTISTAVQSGLLVTTPAILTSLSTSGLLSINTNAIPIGNKYAMQVMVSDNKSARIPLDFILQVVGVSNPPIFDYTVTPLNSSTIKVQPGTPINFVVKARDVDPGSTVSLNASGIPLGATLSPQSGTNPAQFTFSWTPTNANLGTYSLSFSATDNIFVQTLTNINLVVSLAPVFNVPPTPPLLTYNVIAPGQNLSFTVQATDPDPLDVCSITLVNGKDNLNNQIPIYAGVTMTPALPTVSSNTTSSVFSWTPTQTQWGLKPAIFTAQDSYGDKTNHEVNILVNTVPQFTSVPVTSVIATQNYQYNITTVDPDVPYGDDLELHSTNALPTWLTLTDNGDGTGTLSGTPGLADAGTYNISLQVEDIYHHTNAGGIPTQTFTIIVIPCLITINGTTTDLICAGDNSGAIDLTLTGNYGTPTFAWTSPNGYTASSEDISGLAAGSYTVLVSSDLGCTETETYVVGTTPDVTPPTAVAQNLLLQLDANGNASIANDYSVGPISGALPAQNSASVILNQSCNCPTGYVAVGYEGFAGCITDNFRLICKELNPDGTLGAATAVTCFSGGGTTTPFSTSLAGDKVLVGFNVTDVNYQFAGTRIHLSVQGIGKSLAEITGGNANNLNTTLLTGLTGSGCFSSNPASSTRYAPNGHVIVGMEVMPAGYSPSVRFNYAPINQVTKLDNGSTDNCGIASIIPSQTQFTCDDLGDNTVTLTVTDLSGNTATTTATVTVQDNILPTIICPINITVSNDPEKCSAIVVFSVTGSDNCSGVTVVSSPASGSVFPIGETTVTSVATDASGHEATCSFTVTVNDNEAPVATGYNSTFTGQYFTGTNFNSLAVTDEVATINNHWYNSSPYPAQIGVDYFSIRYTGTTVAPATGNYTFRTFSDDGIRLWVNGQLIIDNWTLHPGTYNTGSIALTGNQEVDIKLEFFEQDGYAIAYLEWLAPFAGINSYQAVPARSNSCKNLTIQLDASGLASITTADVDPGFTDACGIESITLSKSNFDCSNIGPNTVILTATDKQGNISTCNAIVTVKDEIDPVAIAQDVIVQLDANGNGSTTAALVNNGSTDACGILSMVLSKTAFTCADIANNPNIVTLTVTDIHGNVGTTTAEVTVKDEVPANVITQDITVQLDATGNVSITAAQVNNGSSDACGIASMSVDPSAFTCSNVGNNTVTLTVTDVNGNVSSQTAVVNVEDNILPTWFTTAGSLNKSVSCGNAGTLAAAMALAPTATDNCSVTITKTTGGLSGNTITNTWSATDANGNSSLTLFTQVITITSVTIDASLSSTPVALGSTATLYAQVTPAEAGISVTFKLDQGGAYGTYGTYTELTDASGVATKTVTGLTVEVYRVYAIAGNDCANSTAYLAVYDPSGGFVTGGGWITSPLGAYVANPALTGKANFGFVSKYKKGSNVPDGNTEFQFHAGSLNFSSSSYNAGSLVIAGKQAIYKGVGTINGVSGYSFMVSAVDGQVSGGGGIDMFRMKIWNTATGAIVYDNNTASADNATPSTALGGGSIVIHAASTKSAEIATVIEPEVGFSGLKAYPNPFSDKLFFEFSREEDTKATLILFDGIGRKISVLFDQQIQANQNYRIEYVPNGLSTNMLFYRMTFDNEVINGKVIYKK